MIEPLKILHKKGASKAELREALAAALGVACPPLDGAAAPNDMQQMRRIWADFYQKQTGMEYQFAIRDNIALKDLEKMITNISQGNAPNTWQVMLEKLPEFYKTKALSLPAIKSGFNAIVAAIKLNNGNKQGVSNDYAQRIADTLCS